MQTSYVYTMHVDTYASISKWRHFWFTALTSALWTCALRDRLASPESQSQKDAKTHVSPLPFADYMLIKGTCLFPAPEEVETKWIQNCLAICISSFLCDKSVSCAGPCNPHLSKWEIPRQIHSYWRASQRINCSFVNLGNMACFPPGHILNSDCTPPKRKSIYCLVLFSAMTMLFPTFSNDGHS